MNTTATMPVCRIEQPPRGPQHETDDEFQRRVDELLAYRTPWWRDAAFACLVIGVLCMAFSATLWLMAH